jgi:tetratricopeptide (TPR) repeat protein
MKKILFIVLSLTALTACAAQPRFMTAGSGSGTQLASLDEATPERSPATPLPQANLPTQELTGKIVYQLLLAEIAAQRGRLNVAMATYFDVAKSTKDPRIAQRATEIAIYARQPREALEAAKLWSDVDPQSQQARQIIVSVLMNEGKLDQAKPYMQKMLAGEDQQVRQSFMELNTLLARQNDKGAALEMAKQLAEPFPKLAEARFAVAQAALSAKQNDVALNEIKQANELKPGWEMGALLQGQIIWQSSKPDAVKFYQEFLGKYPASNDVRLSYARLLASQKDFPAAREQFSTLVKSSSDNPDMVVTVGLLSLQLQDYEGAENYLTQALKLNPKDPNAVRFSLGQISEERKQYDKANEWYKSITEGEQYFQAQIKIASLMARQNKLSDARDYLRNIKTDSAAQKVQIVMAHAGLLREAKAYKDSFDTLDAGLKEYPDNLDLLYDRAMAAEKVDRLEVLEEDLRKLIKLKPDHAHAYNALGYTLADRTNRYEEAHELIKKALEITPDDPFIVDSLGWVQYKLGKLDDSVATLQRAFDLRPDPEIAAHLGEVMWTNGKRNEATQVWQTAIKDHPDNEALNEVVKRFKP